MTDDKKIIASGIVLGGLAVVAGASGSHSLKGVIPGEQLAVFEIAVKYQFYHALALVCTGLLVKNYPGKNFIRAGISFVTGVVLFSGSLYLLACSSLLEIQLHWLVYVTPIGGLLMITGWILLLFGVLRSSP